MALSTKTGDPVLDELVAIKRLLALTLLKAGTSQTDVGVALGVSQGQVSKMFPGGAGKPTKEKAG